MKAPKVKRMTKKKRMEAVIKGEETDRQPVAFWCERIEATPEVQAKKTYGFYQRTGSDMLITSPIPLWKSKGDLRHFLSFHVDADAWEREERYIEALVERGKGEVPLVWTIESPLTTILTLEPLVLTKTPPEELKEYLAQVTEKTCEMVRHIIALGADGVRLFIDQADYAKTVDEFYREFGKPYDVAVLGASSGWCNMVTLEGEEWMLDIIRNYPIQICHWEGDTVLPTIEEVYQFCDFALMAPLPAKDVAWENKTKLTHILYEAMKATGGRRLLFSAKAEARDIEKNYLFLQNRAEEIRNKLAIKES